MTNLKARAKKTRGGAQPYRSGAAFERRTARDMERHGYSVFRVAGSRGAADLVAIKSGRMVLVQCKADGRISPEERTNLRVLSVRCGACPVLAYRQGRNGPVRYARIVASDVHPTETTRKGLGPWSVTE